MQGMGFGGVAGGGGGRPTVRNAVMTMLLPYLLMIFGPVVFGVIGGIIGDTVGSIITGVGQLVELVGFIIMLISVVKMTNELKSVTGNPSFAWWPIFIPCYNYYWMWVAVPQEMAKAKQMRGIQQPARGFIVYFFFFLYAYAADLNDLAKAP